MRIPFLDLSLQHRKIKKDINVALKKVIRRHDFILGEDTVIFEKKFAKYCNRKFAIGVNSGTDALFLGLLSLGIGPGDEVIVPAFTYIATALAVTFTGAKPVFVDIREDTYNMDASKIERSLSKNTKVIMPVHLYGQSADMKPILTIAKNHNLKIIEDAAQAHGARYKISANNWQITGSMGDIGCFSFYPTKNLGAFGDGGMIIVDNVELYKKLIMLRDYGRKSRYEHVMLGYNSRLDSLQAAILRVKLRYLTEWNAMRRQIAKSYTNRLKEIKNIILPYEADHVQGVYHIYAVRVKERDRVALELSKKGIGVLIHYPIPIHLQKVYQSLGYKKNDFPVAEKIAQEIISLPMYPYLRETQIKFITDKLKEILDN